MSIPSVRPPDVPSTEPSAFLENIRKFRTKGEELRAEAKDRENARLLETLQGHLHAIDCVDAVRDRIEVLASELIAEAPGFHLARRLFDGRYMVEMAVKITRRDADGRNVRELSRLAFLLAPEGDDRLLIECHATVRDHDLQIMRLESTMCRDGRRNGEAGRVDEAVEVFLDEQFMGFARAYYQEVVKSDSSSA